MAIFKCKMCGGNLELQEDMTVAECEYCGSVQTVPTADNEKKMTLFSRANRLRAGCEFDKAAGVYEAIVADFPEEAEAYWGLVLCRYGIEYVDDPVTGKKIPTCHRSSFDSILDDPNFDQACENTDAYARRIYRDEAKAIEELRKGIIAVSANEQPYDIFICYKETSENGERTLDSVLAQDIYDALIGRGYRVFFSRITLEDKLGVEYEPYIFAALNSAKVMLAVGTDYEYYNAVWVKNEWSRYLKLMTQDKDKHLIPCFKGIGTYDMPKEFARLQAQDMGKVGAMQDLLRGVEKLVGTGKADAAPAVEAPVSAANPTVESLLRRAFMFLEDGEWKNADEYCEKVLDIDPENARAYLGKLMAELHVATQEALKDEQMPFYGSRNYQKALRFADDALRTELTGCIDHINTRNENARLSGIYSRAKNAMAAAQTEEAYLEAAKLFGSIPAFRDSAELKKSCRKAAEAARKDTIYADAESKMTGEVIASYEKAIALFTSISGWKHANENVEACRRKIEELKARAEAARIAAEAAREAERIAAEAARKDAIYADAESKMTGEVIASYEKAIVLFTSISGWKHADENVEACRRKIEELKARAEARRLAAEEARRSCEKKLADAQARLRQQEAIYAENKSKIFGRGAELKKTANAEIAHLKEEIAEVEQQIIYYNAVVLMETGQYTEAIAAFDAANGYKDSTDQIMECKRLTLKNSQVGDYVLFGAYEQDTANGKEEIEWLVLDVQDGNALLISKYALDCKPYNTSYVHIAWETCTLRSWLNKEFLNAAFSAEEQALIPTVTVPADKNPNYSASPGNATQDRVFLLSIAEANRYFSSATARQCKPTAYAVANGANVNSDSGNCWWWLRSPGDGQCYAARVDSDGGIDEGGDSVIYGRDAVRPALWVNLDS